VGNAGDDAFVFHSGEADGDIIADIAGNGTSINQNDVLVV
jgi:hypothetical protein